MVSAWVSDWGEYIAAFALFFLSHSVPVRPRVKSALSTYLGARGFTLAYSMLSIAVLAWLIVAAGRAPYVELWPSAALSWLPQIGMLIVCVLAALALGRPNPLSFGGSNNDRFDPDHPGIVGWARHPLLICLLIWSGTHLLANGALAHVILFGTFAGFSGLGMWLIDRRKKRQLGQQEWTRLGRTRRMLTVTPNGVIRVLVGIGIYGLILWAHGPVIGVSALF